LNSPVHGQPTHPLFDCHVGPRGLPRLLEREQMNLPGIEMIRLELEFRVRVLVKPSSEQRQKDLNAFLDENRDSAGLCAGIQNLPASLEFVSLILPRPDRRETGPELRDDVRE